MNFTFLTGFGSLFDLNTTYYALDYSANRIIIFDSNWQYLTFKNFTGPAYMITVNNSLYISCNNNVYKTDKYLNITSQYNSYDCYRGLYYNSSNNTIYVSGGSKIYIFDLNLTLVDSIQTKTYQLYSLQGYKNYIYAGTHNSSCLLVIENKVIIQIYPICNSGTLTSILIDHFGYIVLSCNIDKKVYLYYSSNMTYTNKSLTYAGVYPHFINFDSNDQFVIISTSLIDIFN